MIIYEVVLVKNDQQTDQIELDNLNTLSNSIGYYTKEKTAKKIVDDGNSFIKNYVDFAIRNKIRYEIKEVRINDY